MTHIRLFGSKRCSKDELGASLSKVENTVEEMIEAKHAGRNTQFPLYRRLAESAP